MKTLKKEAIQEIAKKHGVKSIDLANFVNRVTNLKKDEVESELIKFKTQAGVTKSLYKAAVEAVSEMVGGEISTKKSEKQSLKEKDEAQSKKIKKDKAEKEGKNKEEKKEKKESSGKGDSFKAKYVYPEKMTDKEKKAFRVKARKEAEKWAKILSSKDVTDKQKKEYKAWAKETYGE